MNKIIFIADFFANEVNGGGELNNQELINIIKDHNYNIECINSRNCSYDFIKNNKSSFFIIGNFIELHKSCLAYLQENCKYVIYEHDHKYLLSRNPADYKDFIAPKDHIINQDFYKYSIGVLCQSSYHYKIISKNLSDINLINLSGNLWSIKTLQLLSDFSNNSKKDYCAIMESNNWHKNTKGAVEYCKIKNLSYKLIPSMKYEDFLNELSKCKKLVFFPQTPETLSRIVVESRMMGLSTITNDKIGATYEEWFNMKGRDLINFMTNKRLEITKKVLELI